MKAQKQIKPKSNYTRKSNKQKPKFFESYIQCIDPQMDQTFQDMLFQIFPNEMELKMSTRDYKATTAQLLVNDKEFISQFIDFIHHSQGIKMFNVPQNFKEALQIFLLERHFLIELIEALINQILPHKRPQIFKDSFLEREYEKLINKRGLSVTPTQQISLHSFQIDLQEQRNASHKKNTSQTPPTTVIEDLVHGASSLISMIGQGFKKKPRQQQKQNQQNQLQNINGKKAMYLRIAPGQEESPQRNQQIVQMNGKYQQAIKQKENIFPRTINVPVQIDANSDSDDDVDITDSSETNSRRQSRIGIQTHKMPNRGVVNMNRLEQPSISPKLRKDNPNKIRINSYNRYAGPNFNEEEEKIPVCDIQKVMLQDDLLPMDEFIDMIEQNESKILNNQKNELYDSRSTVNNAYFQVQSQFPQNQLNQSGVQMRNTYSKLHQDFSSIKSSQSERQDSEESLEKKKRREIGLKMLMSRESSFGATGFKTDSRSNNKSLQDDSFTNQMLQNKYQQKKKFYQDSDDEQEPSELQFKIKKRKKDPKKIEQTKEIEYELEMEKTESKTNQSKLNAGPKVKEEYYYIDGRNQQDYDKSLRVSKKSTQSQGILKNQNSRNTVNSVYKSEVDIMNKMNKDKYRESKKQSLMKSVKFGNNYQF